jgi:RTX calcium-binding nonapeptide repeat (4 copies)
MLGLHPVAGLTSFSQLAISDTAQGAQIAFGADTISLTGVGAAPLTATNLLLPANVTPVGQTLVGTEGANTLRGTGFGDRIEGRGGNDQLIGNGGDDTFVFHDNAPGRAEVTDFNAAEGDHINFSESTAVRQMSDLAVTDDGHGNALLSYTTPNGAASIPLDHIAPNAVHHDWFVF